MTFYIDLDLLRVVATPGYTSPVEVVRVRRNDTPTFTVKFVQSGVVVDPGAAATTLHFAANAEGNYLANANLIATDTFEKSGTGTSTQYALEVPFVNDALNTAFNLVSNANALNLMGEFTWFNAAGTVSVTTEAFALEVANDLYRGATATVPTQSTAVFLPGVTALTGGGATSLDGVLTAPVTVPQVYVLSIGNSSQLWALVAGTDAEDSAAGVVRGDDFNALTNAKVFKRIG
jgi:hypothetical protein